MRLRKLAVVIAPLSLSACFYDPDVAVQLQQLNATTAAMKDDTSALRADVAALSGKVDTISESNGQILSAVQQQGSVAGRRAPLLIETNPCPQGLPHYPLCGLGDYQTRVNRYCQALGYARAVIAMSPSNRPDSIICRD